MENKVRVVGLTLGDPIDPASRSGVNLSLFSQLSAECDLVKVFDLDLDGIRKIALAAATFSPDRRRWGNKLHQNSMAFDIRSRKARRLVAEMKEEFDLIFQDGAMFAAPSDLGRPLASYHDSNVILSSRAGPLSQGAHYKVGSLARAIDRERKVYDSASAIFTMSDWLKRSLIADFRIDEAKIHTVYAGTNLPQVAFDKVYDGRTILFVGGNFERKGGGVLLEAFRKVRKVVSGARLIIAGPEIKIAQEGVEVRGRVTDKNQLAELFRSASVFAMPSFYEPFGIVFAEALAFKTPCIGSDVCAMPEIIQHERGGLIVPLSDPDALADAIVLLLKDERLSREMGDYGWNRSRELFNWSVVARKMVDGFGAIVRNTAD